MEEYDDILDSCSSSIASNDSFNQVFICSEEGCSSKFSKRSHLEQHMCSHSNERPFVCTNDGCDKRYKRRDHLNRHMKFCSTSSLLDEDSQCICPKEGCGLKFPSSDLLRKHIQDSHVRKKTLFPCSFEGCSRVFKKHQNLRAHEYDHTQENYFKCPHPGCEMTFRWMTRLKRHKKIHEGYTCSECNETFEKWTLLLKHKASSVHKVESACPVCQKVFLHRYLLKRHMKIHSEEREVHECTYEGCGRYYSEKRNLDAHIRSYHEGQRIQCSHEGCDRTFAFKHKMLEHLKMHSSPVKVKKKYPKKGHRKKTVFTMLTGLEKAGISKESSDSDELPSSYKPEIPSVSTLFDWGGNSEIWNEDNSQRINTEGNSSALVNYSQSNENQLAGRHTPANTNNTENPYCDFGSETQEISKKESEVVMAAPSQMVMLEDSTTPSKNFLGLARAEEAISSNEPTAALQTSGYPLATYSPQKQMVTLEHSASPSKNFLGLARAEEAISSNEPTAVLQTSGYPLATYSPQKQMVTLEHSASPSKNFLGLARAEEAISSNEPTAALQTSGYPLATYSPQKQMVTLEHSASPSKNFLGLARTEKAISSNEPASQTISSPFATYSSERPVNSYATSPLLISDKIPDNSKNPNQDNNNFAANGYKWDDDPDNDLQILGIELSSPEKSLKRAPTSQNSTLESPKKPQLFSCPRKKCRNVYTTQQKLYLHLQCDHDRLGFQCTYSNCGKVFDSQQSLDKHFVTHNVKIRLRTKKRLARMISCSLKN